MNELRIEYKLDFALASANGHTMQSTGSRLITAVKQHRARSVLGRVTTWEHRVLLHLLIFFPSKVDFKYDPLVWRGSLERVPAQVSSSSDRVQNYEVRPKIALVLLQNGR
ncbi:hypothetical protein AVEN_123092-1 [Araneus ventricosus]|uniref:Uncharacterized protein n=1 Tax=Araneus ventricosus TaxID=182803 RepID=A0A4Y2WKQ0_ARAVE|nr:hypothetical protein AVEN_123092-1 [Araneus ventricosus]